MKSTRRIGIIAIALGIIALLAVFISSDGGHRPTGATLASGEGDLTRSNSSIDASVAGNTAQVDVEESSNSDSSSATTSKRYQGHLARARQIWEETKVVGEARPSAGGYVQTSFYRAEGLKYENIRFDEVYTADPNSDSEVQLIQQEAYIADHFIVRLRPEQEGLLGAILNKFHELNIRDELSTGDHVLLEFPLNDDFEHDAFAFWSGRLAAHGLNVEKDRLGYPTAVPQDPHYDYQWALNNTGIDPDAVDPEAPEAIIGVEDADIDAPEAWDLATGSSDVIVAVIDTGIDLDHPDLISRLWRTGSGSSEKLGFDATTGSFLPADTNGHGTHVAGIIGARPNNGRAIAGVNWDVRIMAVKVFLAIPDPENDEDIQLALTSDIIAGLDFAVANGASIVNMSLGIVGVGENSDEDSFYVALKDARDFGSQGVLVVASAGNGGLDAIGDDTDTIAHYPSSYDLNNVISVAASDRNDVLADFSNFGATSVDLAAPGVQIVSTYPDDTENELNGTSMASPFVAGVAALAKSVDQSMTYYELRNVLLRSVDKKDAFKDVTVTGGRLNAHNAVLAAGSGPAVIVSGINFDLGSGVDFWLEGETLKVDVGLLNLGGEPASNISMLLEIVSGDATVTTATKSVTGSMVSGEELYVAEAFELTAGDLGAFGFSEEVEVRVTVTYEAADTTEYSQLEYATKAYYQEVLLSGVVKDGANDLPIEGATVTIQAKTVASGIVELDVVTGADGKYEFTLFTGIVAASAVADGYVDSIVKVIDLNPVEGDQEYDITLGIGDFSVQAAAALANPIEVTVPANTTQSIDLQIQNLSSFPDPLSFVAEVSEQQVFGGLNQLYGMVGLGVNQPELVYLNRFRVTEDSSVPMTLPAGQFSVDFTVMGDSIWVLTLEQDGTNSICEFSAETGAFIRTVELYLGLIPWFNGTYLNNDDVSVETIFVVPYPDDSEPSGFREELAVITHDAEEIFNVNVYRVDPDSLDIPTREIKIADLDINSISWWTDLSRRNGAYGGDRDSFFYARGINLYEYQVTGSTSVTELKETSLFALDDNIFFFFDELDFVFGDVKSLTYFGVGEIMYVLLNSSQRNLLAVDWDTNTLLRVYDSPSGVDRITSSSGNTGLDWLKMPFISGSIGEDEIYNFPITIDTTAMAVSDQRTGYIRYSSEQSDTVEIVSVKLTVGTLGLDASFVSWYQGVFGRDPVDYAIEDNSDGAGNPDGLEYLTGTNPLDASDDVDFPAFVFDRNGTATTSDDVIYIKFRKLKSIADDVITVQGSETMDDDDSFQSLVEGVDYEVIFRDTINDDVEELTLSFTSPQTKGSYFYRLLIDI